MKRDNSGEPETAGESRVDFHASLASGDNPSALDEMRRKLAAEREQMAASVEVPPKRGRGWQKGRPRTRAVVEPSGGGMAPTAEQWGQLIAALQTNKLADQEVASTLYAHAMQKALYPENKFNSGVSAYSPEGGTRPVPNGDFYLNGWPAPGQPPPRSGFPICARGDTFTVTNTEIMLLNTLQAGTYKVTKADGTETKAGVVQHLDLGGKVESTVIMIQIADDEQKNNWPPLVQLLAEITTGESPSKSYARMEAKIKELETKLAASAA